METVAQRGVQFIIGIVLARLLFPEQFGLIGMLMIFMAVILTFLDSGFGAALIQKKEVTKTDICSISYFNILMGLVAACLLCLVAPWIAAFYNQPILTPLTRALSLTIVINSFGMIQDTVLIPGTSYNYTVAAYDIVGNTSVQSVATDAQVYAGATLCLLICGKTPIRPLFRLPSQTVVW